MEVSRQLHASASQTPRKETLGTQRMRGWVCVVIKTYRLQYRCIFHDGRRTWILSIEVWWYLWCSSTEHVARKGRPSSEQEDNIKGTGCGLDSSQIRARWLSYRIGKYGYINKHVLEITLKHLWQGSHMLYLGIIPLGSCVIPFHMLFHYDGSVCSRGFVNIARKYIIDMIL